MSYRPEQIARAGITLLGFSGILFAPWWAVVVCMVLLSLRYAAWEVPLMGACMDLAWLPFGGFFSIPVFSIVGILIVWGMSPIRRQLLL